MVEIGEDEQSPYMVMELVDGETLSAILDRGPLSEVHCLSVARSLAGALAEVHRHGMVHQDIKPSNIVIESSGRAKVIDFEFVTQAKDRAGEGHEQALGTFLYSPPEQLGTLRRPVDGRADLYALGAVLFQCVTGRPPFQVESVADLLRHHATLPAPNVRELNPSVGPALAEIIATLLAKDPDDRYQTARGLLADLEDLSRLESAHRAGRPVPLRAKDTDLRLTFEIPLVGRQEETEILRGAWERVPSCQGAVLQIEGEPGGGKTRLALELTSFARQHDGLVLMGKAQQLERTPFGPLREAIDGYLSQVLRMPGDRKEWHLLQLREAAGEFAGLVKHLSKSLQRVLGDVADTRPLERADEEQRRFYRTMARFFADLARRHTPMLLVIDDIQWLDDGTLEILKELASQLPSAPLLLLTSARNDHPSEEARERFVKELGEERVRRIVLGSLGADEIGEFTAAHLGGRKVEDQVMGQLGAVSNGNPFVLAQYIRALCEQGMLRPTADVWLADTARFGQASIPTDVSQLLANRVAALGNEAHAVLRVAAVIGFEFSYGLLLDAAGENEDRLKFGLGEAFRANLVEKTATGSYQFVHDRVAEAALSMLDGDQRRDIHQAVAEAMERAGGPEEFTFELARHYAEGHADKHQQRVYETSWAAGARALREHDYRSAFQLLDRALATARTIGAPAQDLAAMEELAGIAASRIGRNRTAHEYLQQALARATTKDDRARLNRKIACRSRSKSRPLLAAWPATQNMRSHRGHIGEIAVW